VTTWFHYNSAMQNPARVRWIVVLAACLAVSLVCVIYPIYVIRPFRAQGPRELAVALAIVRARGLVTAISALAAIGAALLYGRTRPPLRRRIGTAALAAAVCVLAALARVNVYEQLMFHPEDHPAFVSAAAAKIDSDDKLIAVNTGGAARAYPVRIMGYHHVINDNVGGTALVATY
jgi:hypothetical protein